MAAAAHDVLVSRFQVPAPNAGLIAQVDMAYTNYLAEQRDWRSTTRASRWANRRRMNIILNRANDGSFPANPEIFTGSTEPRPVAADAAGVGADGTPWMGNVTPFAQKDREGLLHEPGPPHLTSGAYTKDYNEVKALGRRTGSYRTPEQTTMALVLLRQFRHDPERRPADGGAGAPERHRRLAPGCSRWRTWRPPTR